MRDDRLAKDNGELHGSWERKKNPKRQVKIISTRVMSPSKKIRQKKRENRSWKS